MPANSASLVSKFETSGSLSSSRFCSPAVSAIIRVLTTSCSTSVVSTVDLTSTGSLSVEYSSLTERLSSPAAVLGMTTEVSTMAGSKAAGFKTYDTSTIEGSKLSGSTGGTGASEDSGTEASGSGSCMMVVSATLDSGTSKASTGEVSSMWLSSGTSRGYGLGSKISATELSSTEASTPGGDKGSIVAAPDRGLVDSSAWLV
eukprot:Gregarina_sp_Poly_1__410@NODE_10_length_23460_cov_121_463087_g8_i1_p12_GENE_NODE_10_length_23460_cov_121_463087_g8_i1NODE_10_length_23460_cov_121_463087_g8_i1_p12_ORF_typecomplete_len202_score23_63EnoRase_NADH_b/PF12242_8/0_068_NODE_10_length_23460_cov_121_463087_g8_i11410714712